MVIPGTRLKQLHFDQDLIERMHDFREAYLDASEYTVLAEAVRDFISAQIANNPDIRRRWQAIRARKGRSLD